MKLKLKPLLKTINTFRTDERGAEAPEWIALVAVLLILSLALSFTVGGQGASLGQQIVDQVGCKVSSWTGGGGCGSGGPAVTTGGGPSTTGGNGTTQPVNTGGNTENSGGNSGNSDGNSDDEGGGGFLGWLGNAGSTVWGHGVDFVEGVVIDGLWEDVKGTVVMLWDGSVMLPGTGHIIDWTGLADRDATFDKYSELWDHMKERGFGGTLWDLTLREPVELWQNGEPGSAIGYGVYNIGMLFVPGDEAAKLSKFTKVEQVLPDGTIRLIVNVERLSPDELAGLIARTEDLLPDELADLRRGIDALSETELNDLRALMRDKTPEELAAMGLDVDDLKKVGICSFSANTPVTTMSGLRPISQLAIGEMVLAYDEHENKVSYYPVTATWVHEDPLIVTLTIDGERIETTPGHPFYVDGEWIYARDLWVGARIVNGNSGSGIVQQIELLAQTQLMYNLTVETAHTYYVGAGQWLVHNAGDCPIDPDGALRQRAEAQLGSNGKFTDPDLEAGYLRYVERKTKQGQTPRDRADWKVASDYMTNDSPLARGNKFNEIANDNYTYNEIQLENGKRLDAYDPDAGEIISRKATDFDVIEEQTFRNYLNEMKTKYAEGTIINSRKYDSDGFPQAPIDGQPLKGDYVIEVPSSNVDSANRQVFEQIAADEGVIVRYTDAATGEIIRDVHP